MADFIETSRDRIPNFGVCPTIVAVKSGNWSDPTTWNMGRVPEGGDDGGTVVACDVVEGVQCSTDATQNMAPRRRLTDIQSAD